MIRLLISIVFAFAVLAASSAHASMLSTSFMHVQSIGLTDVSKACSFELKTFVAKAGPNCSMAMQKNTGSQRCQVDIAPVNDRVSQVGMQGLSTNRAMNDSTPKDWVSEPVLGPPRLV